MFYSFIEYAKTHSIDDVMREWGGVNIYIPSKKDDYAELIAKYNELKDKVEHSKLIFQLSREFDLSTSRVYALTKEHRPPSDLGLFANL